jgi:hypothetical protein
MATWIDPEEGLRALLAQETSATLAQIGVWPAAEPPLATDDAVYISVEIIDGYATELEDEPIVEINVWGRKWSKVKSTHVEISDAILRYPRSVAVGDRRFVIDNPRCNSRAAREDWPDEKVRRMSAVFQFSVRR